MNKNKLMKAIIASTIIFNSVPASHVFAYEALNSENVIEEVQEDIKSEEVVEKQAEEVENVEETEEASDSTQQAETFSLTAQTDDALTGNWDEAVKNIKIAKGSKETISVNGDVIEYVKKHTNVKNITGKIDGDVLTVDMQLKDVYLDSNYINGASEPGISFYNMVNFYTNVLQVKEIMGDNYASVKDSKGNVCDAQYITDMLTLLDKIMRFDPNGDYLTYVEKNNGTDVEGEFGSAKLQFHIDSHGWWGYELGARDNITGMIMGAGKDYWPNAASWMNQDYAKIQNEYATKYTNFFKIKMPYNSDGQSTVYMLNTTDLENPMIYVSVDGKEAFMIDVDMYGHEALTDVIKGTIGSKCEKLKIFLTHNHPDHVNNLDLIAADLELKDKVEIIWPENEPYPSTNPETLFGTDKVTKVADGEKFMAAGTEFEFIEIPEEHTPAGGQLADLTNKVVYCGDSLGAQVHLGGTNISGSSAIGWLKGARKSYNYMKKNGMKYYIGGHTPYLNTPEFSKWLATGVEYAINTDTTGLILIENDKVVNGTDRYDEIMSKGLSDSGELNVCSFNFRGQSNAVLGDVNSAYDRIETLIKQADGSIKNYPLSATLRSHLANENLIAVKDEENKTLTIDQQLNGVFLTSDYINGKTEPGISYYTMMNFYATLLQAQQMLVDNPDYKIVDSQGKEYDKALIDEFVGLVKQINDFDPTTNLQYDWASAYDSEEFKNETHRGGTDVIATSKEGNISFEFHIDSHGWWGYDLGAHDSITGLILGLDAEQAHEQQHDLTMSYGQFFVIKMKEDDKGTWYMLNNTDLENPVVYVSKDGKEAFMIDVDFYGAHVLNDVIKSVIGDKCESLKIFLTHNHGDHVNNLAVIGQDKELREMTTIVWPENEPHTVLSDKDGTVKEMVGKDLISDIDWKEVMTVKDNEKFEAAGHTFQFIEIPTEHTPGGGQLADLTNKVVYCGDSLGAQVHLGGTTITADKAQAWLDGANKSYQYMKDNGMKYYIGGHTPYLNTLEFSKWLATGIEYAMGNAQEGYNLIIVENGKVVNGTDRFDEIMANGLSDRDELNVCSLGFIKPKPEQPTEPDKPTVTTPTDTNKPQAGDKVKTGDETNMMGYGAVLALSALGLIILKKKKATK